MAEKKIQTRIRQKVDTKANWDKATNFIPLKGEIIIYSDLNQAKVGDGTTKVGALPFLKGKADASDKNPTLAWGSKSTVATVDGVDIHVTMPSNPNTHQSIKTLNTNNTSAQTASSSEAIAGSGTINLHKVAKTGSYNDLNDKPNIVKYTNATVEVAGTKKTVAAVSPSALYVGNGLIMGGTAAAAGLVTRGICGVMTPDSTGACTKENLYLNYDGDNNYSRKVVLGAGSVGNSIAGGATTFSAVRGDQMVGYVNSLALIKSGKQTTTSTADGGSNVYTFTDTKGATSTFTVKNGSKGSTGSQGPQGPQGIQGPGGAAAGFGTPTASVDANVGTPSVTITSSGPNTAKIFNFAFKNLKGATGGIGPQGPEGPRGPQGPQGEKGATGSVASVTNSGSGNVVTDVSLNTSTKVLTVTKNKTLATVATSGSYTDLTNKPTIPTVPTNFVTTNTEQTISGTKNFSTITANTIGTGTNANNYFQSQKFRGEGDANTYYHAVDFGYAGHDQVDFYEYGGIYNFYRNQQADTKNKQLLLGINPSGIKLPTVTGAKVLGTNADGQVESHTLGIADISSLQSTLDGKMAKSDLSYNASTGVLTIS